ncbi:uncharacterized protein MONBRDRAFT_36786 [Monosiga brevicollis MX1]|uniref:Brix domain-containing protein n=1 Tax=Monosiga brevicollis TaxID=81824 RepID=A9UXR5_MONBE|nr:uncharacterized protein MONBRDRAFT_36786 [Monosiga brevicollis MX1]EDQ89890.1 predicted protein [Monosiga brevicollis MX1]|eukprot:XP_001745312.1 hypothetical protein [Monosiga brevicollis MX1]
MGKPNQARAHAKRAAKRDEDQMVENINAAVHPKIAKLDLQMKDRSQRTFPKWTNRQRTLVFSSRGISFQVRHLLQDLRVLMPHSKKDVKMDRKDRLNEIVPEICEMKNCNNCIYIEMRKKKDVYMWMSKMPMGPSVKFLVTDIYTMSELKLTGNCLRGSRPLLQFDQAFDSQPHYQLLKEILFQTFATPNQHPKSKAFVDHIFSFSILEDRIWFRNYQVTWKEPGKVGKDSEMVLTEIGPRFCLQVIRIFEGTFGGPTLFENADYVSPNMQRSMLRDEAAAKDPRRRDQRVSRRRKSCGTSAQRQ